MNEMIKRQARTQASLRGGSLPFLSILRSRNGSTEPYRNKNTLTFLFFPPGLPGPLSFPRFSKSALGDLFPPPFPTNNPLPFAPPPRLAKHARIKPKKKRF